MSHLHCLVSKTGPLEGIQVGRDLISQADHREAGGEAGILPTKWALPAQGESGKHL